MSRELTFLIFFLLVVFGLWATIEERRKIRLIKKEILDYTKNKGWVSRGKLMNFFASERREIKLKLGNNYWAYLDMAVDELFNEKLISKSFNDSDDYSIVNLCKKEA